MTVLAWQGENGWFEKSVPKGTKGFSLLRIQNVDFDGLVLLEKFIKRRGDTRETRNEAPINVAQSQETSQLCLVLGMFSLL